MRWIRLVLITLQLGILIALGGCTRVRARSSILITVDTLRADHLSAYGYQRPTSPHLESFAAEGVVCRRAFSASASTAPSTASILTGLMPSFHDVGLLNGKFVLGTGTPTLATLLRQHGVRTGAVVSNPVLARRLGLDRGFEVYDDRFEGHELNRPDLERRADRAVDIAIQWLEDVSSERFFLWLHLQDPHGPYTPLPEWERLFARSESNRASGLLARGEDHSGLGAIPRYQHLEGISDPAAYVDRYDAEIAHADHQIGRLLQFLRTNGLEKTTLVAITADHGEAFGEDGYFFAHSHSVGRDQVWVPLLLAGPGVEKGAAVTWPVSNVSLFATILEAMGVDTPPGPQQQALHPLPTLAKRDPHPVFFETPNQVGIAVGNLWYRRDRVPAEDSSFWGVGNPNTGGAWKPLGEETESQVDPGEAPVSPAEVNAALQQLEDYESRASAARTRLATGRQSAADDPRLKAMLRALGYAQ